jgi:hypothetical protein
VIHGPDSGFEIYDALPMSGILQHLPEFVEYSPGLGEESDNNPNW